MDTSSLRTQTVKQRLRKVERDVIAKRRSITELEARLAEAEKDVAQKSFRLQLQRELQQKLSALVEVDRDKAARIELLADWSSAVDTQKLTLQAAAKMLRSVGQIEALAERKAKLECVALKLQQNQTYQRDLLVRMVLGASERQAAVQKQVAGSALLHVLYEG